MVEWIYKTVMTCYIDNILSQGELLKLAQWITDLAKGTSYVESEQED
jgi:hypothetical protein